MRCFIIIFLSFVRTKKGYIIITIIALQQQGSPPRRPQAGYLPARACPPRHPRSPPPPPRHRRNQQQLEAAASRPSAPPCGSHQAAACGCCMRHTVSAPPTPENSWQAAAQGMVSGGRQGRQSERRPVPGPADVEQAEQSGPGEGGHSPGRQGRRPHEGRPHPWHRPHPSPRQEGRRSHSHHLRGPRATRLEQQPDGSGKRLVAGALGDGRSSK